MATLSPEVWAVLVVLTLAGVTAVLHTLARFLQSERELHDLRLRVQAVRADYARRLAELASRGEVIEVEPVEP